MYLIFILINGNSMYYFFFFYVQLLELKHRKHQINFRCMYEWMILNLKTQFYKFMPSSQPLFFSNILCNLVLSIYLEMNEQIQETIVNFLFTYWPLPLLKSKIVDTHQQFQFQWYKWGVSSHIPPLLIVKMILILFHVTTPSLGVPISLSQMCRCVSLEYVITLAPVNESTSLLPSTAGETAIVQLTQVPTSTYLYLPNYHLPTPKGSLVSNSYLFCVFCWFSEHSGSFINVI